MIFYEHYRPSLTPEERERCQAYIDVVIASWHEPIRQDAMRERLETLFQRPMSVFPDFTDITAPALPESANPQVRTSPGAWTSS